MLKIRQRVSVDLRGIQGEDGLEKPSFAAGTVLDNDTARGWITVKLDLPLRDRREVRVAADRVMPLQAHPVPPADSSSKPQ